MSRNHQKGDDVLTVFLGGCVGLIFFLMLLGGIAGVFMK